LYILYFSVITQHT